MNCAICNSSNSQPIFQDTLEASEWILNKVKYGYVRCLNCKFVQCDPLPPQADLTEFYHETYNYEWFDRNMFFKKIQARHRAWKIRTELKPGLKYLDFGCGHGFFVDVLLAKGLNVQGFDIGSEKIAVEKGSITYADNFESYKGTDFDLITAWHVIEHMRDVNQTIRQLAGRLRPGGKLLIGVPNIESSGSLQFGQKWGWFQQPYVHISHFGPDTLSKLLQNHGFTIQSVRTSDTWDQGLYDNLISFFFYRNKSRNPVRKFGSSALGNIVFKINQLVRLGFAFISYGLGLFRGNTMRGSELRIIAVKDR